MKIGIVGLSSLTGRLAETAYDFLDIEGIYMHDNREKVEDYLELAGAKAEYTTLEKLVDETDVMIVDKEVDGKDLKGYQGRIIVVGEPVDEKTQALYEDFGGYTCQVMGLDNVKTRRLERLLKRKMQMMDSCSVQRVEAEVLGGQIMPVNIKAYTSEGEKRVIDYPELSCSMKVTQEEIDEVRQDVVGDVEKYHALKEVLVGLTDGKGRFVMSVPYKDKFRGQPVIVEGNKVRVVKSAVGGLYDKELLHDGYGISERERFEQDRPTEVAPAHLRSIDDITDDDHYGEDSGVREIRREMEANPRDPAPRRRWKTNRYLELSLVAGASILATGIGYYLII